MAFWPMVKSHGRCIVPNLCSENQFCVPLMEFNAPSYRTRKRRRPDASEAESADARSG